MVTTKKATTQIINSNTAVFTTLRPPNQSVLALTQFENGTVPTVSYGGTKAVNIINTSRTTLTMAAGSIGSSSLNQVLFVSKAKYRQILPVKTFASKARIDRH